VSRILLWYIKRTLKLVLPQEIGETPVAGMSIVPAGRDVSCHQAVVAFRKRRYGLSRLRLREYRFRLSGLSSLSRMRPLCRLKMRMPSRRRWIRPPGVSMDLLAPCQRNTAKQVFRYWRRQL